MALDTQTLQVDLTGGLDERTDSKAVQPGKVTSIVNANFDKNGAVRKRRGMTAIADGILLPEARRLAAHNDELLGLGQDFLYSYSSALDQWVTRDQVPETFITTSTVAPTSELDQSPSVAYAAGFYIYTWGADSQTHIYVSVIDADTGVAVFSNYPLVTLSGSDGAIYPRVITVGGFAYVMWIQSVSGVITIKCRSLNLSAPNAWSNSTTLATSVITSHACLDAVGLDDRFAIVYGDSTGTIVSTFDVNMALIVTVSLGAHFSDFAAIDGAQDDKLWVATTMSTGAIIVTLDPITLATISTGTISGSPTSLALKRYDDTSAVLVAGYAAPAATVGSVYLVSGASLIPNARTSSTYNAYPISRPFIFNTRVYCEFQLPLDGQVTNVVVDLEYDRTFLSAATFAARIVGMVAPRTVPFDPDAVAGLPLTDVASPADGKFVFSFLTLTRTIYNLSVSSALVDFSRKDNWLPVYQGPTTTFSGGLPSLYDGNLISELGFAHYPVLSVVSTSTSGGFLGNGSYQYVAVYSYTDSSGQLHRSAPSVVQTVATGMGTTNSVVLKVENLHLTTKNDDDSLSRPVVFIEIYRTTVDGTVFYLQNRTLESSLDAFSQNYNDSASDISISANEILYTTGGVVPNVCPPAFSCIAAYKLRLFGANGSTLWYSKEIIPGEGPAFSDLFTIPIPEGGDITAIAQLDSNLIIFKETKIFALTGEGPSDTFASNDYATPQLMATDVGCTEPRSVVLMPAGLMFQSAKGIYILSRSLEAAYIGKDVEDTVNNNYSTITGAVLLTDQQQVRFSCSNGSTGVIVFFDYVQGAWGVHHYPDNEITTSIALHEGTYHALSASGVTTKESSTTWTDDGAWVTMDVEFAWVKMSGLHGYQRVRRASLLGDHYSACNVTVRLATDYNPAYNETHTWISGYTNSTPSPDLIAHVKNQKCTAIRVRYTDAQASYDAIGTGRGMSINGIALELGIKRGLRKVPASQRA